MADAPKAPVDYGTHWKLGDRWIAVRDLTDSELFVARRNVQRRNGWHWTIYQALDAEYRMRQDRRRAMDKGDF